ncbi:hypothetical protein [Streptomyces bacillaris]|uniref:hypothetical protein n=1 Tax=Streptomyces bacillaris TaxID=68179 RepID=UPI00363CC670
MTTSRAQARAHASLVLIHRLVHRRGLTVEQAVTAVAQSQRNEPGPHTTLVAAEAMKALVEATTPIRALLESLAPAAKARAQKAAAALRAAADRLARPATPPDENGRYSRPAWVSPYGPPPRKAR